MQLPASAPDNASDQGAVLVFDGALHAPSFVGFCAHRAARLSLRHTVLSQSPARVEVAVHGHHTLIDMFEMACSLGPDDCIVLSTWRNRR